jgi:hypothetical protein
MVKIDAPIRVKKSTKARGLQVRLPPDPSRDVNLLNDFVADHQPFLNEEFYQRTATHLEDDGISSNGKLKHADTE